MLLSGKRMKGVCAVVAMCLCAAMTIPDRNVWALTMSEEVEIGKKTLEEIRKHMQLVEDGEVISYVQSIGRRIAAQTGVTPYQFQFFILDESVPNAFAVPGGYVFIYRGLIEILSSEGELAGVLSHELAHIQARHMHRKIQENRILTATAIAGMLAGIFLGAKSGAGPALSMGSAAGVSTAALKYSRDYEMEADQIGFKYLISAGYKPSEMAGAMEEINKTQWLTNSKIPSYMLTHPALSERVEYLRDMAKSENKSRTKHPLIKDLGDFPIMKAALTAEYADPKYVETRFEAGIAKGDVASVYGLGRLYLRQGKTAEALAKLQEAARLKPDSPFVLSSLGAAYFQANRLPEAQRVLQSALTLDPSSLSAHYRLGLVLEDLGQKEEALQHFQEIAEFAPPFPEVDYHLGTLYGQVNRLGPAHLHLGRYYEHKQDWKVALFHYQKAKALITDSPQLIEELGRTNRELEKKVKNASYMDLKTPGSR